MSKLSCRTYTALIGSLAITLVFGVSMQACLSSQKLLEPTGFQPGANRIHPEPEVTRIEIPPLKNPPTHYNHPQDRHPAQNGYQANMYRRVKKIAQSLNRPAPVYDSRLSFAADTIVEAADSIKHRPVELVYFALSRQGIVESDFFQRIFRLTGDLDQHTKDLNSMLLDLLSMQGCDQIGFGSRVNLDHTRLGVVLCQPRLVETTAIPRRLEKHTSVDVRAKLLPPYQQPKVYVTEPNGRVRSINTHNKADGKFSFRFGCGSINGRYRVEILGFLDDCPVVAANFPIWCSQDPEQSFSMKTPVQQRHHPSSPGDVEKTIFALINQDRKRHHLQPLAWHPEAAEVARSHSRQMQITGKIGHHSDSTGTPLDRAQQAGLRFGFLAENIGTGISADEIHHSLMESPGHRQAILSSQATHVGIGAAFSKRLGEIVSVLVTELYLGPPSTQTGSTHTKIKSHANQQPDNPVKIRSDRKGLEGCRVLGMSRREVQASSDQDLDAARQTGLQMLQRKAGEIGADTMVVESKRAGSKLTLYGFFYGCHGLRRD